MRVSNPAGGMVIRYILICHMFIVIIIIELVILIQ